MESHQRRVSFRMKKRGMHWSKEGAEAMVKVKQGIANNTLKEVYLASQHRSHRKQREVKKAVRMSEYLRQPIRPSIGVKQGSISLYSAHYSVMWRLFKILNQLFTPGLFDRFLPFRTYRINSVSKRQRGSQ